jgi:general secretion pathway protein A
VAQRLRIAGSSGDPVFDPDALHGIHLYSGGIPRVVNLICEHCLVSAFVDQQKVVTQNIVEAVARDFDLGEGNITATLAAPSQGVAGKFDLVDALKTLANLADRLRESERDLPKERKL